MRRLAAVLLPCFLLLASCATTPPPEPVDQEIENLRAFAKLYGYIRWFHPSDEAAAIDWDRFAVYGAEQVRHAESAVELEEVLASLFAPVAPTLVVHRVDASPSEVPQCSKSASEYVAWQHAGAYLGTLSNIYRSHRLNRKETLAFTTARGFGTWGKAIDAEPYRGREVRLLGAARVETLGPGSQAQLWMRVDRNKEMGFFDNMSDRPITSQDWTEAEIVGEVAADATRIVFGGFLQGSGRAWLDRFSLSVLEDSGEWQRIPVEDPGFEKGDGWWHGGSGYRFSILDDGREGRRAALIDGSPELVEMNAPLFDARPTHGETTSRTLGSGLVATFPVSLASVDNHTCPTVEANTVAVLSATLEGIDVRSVEVPAVRYASIVIAWNAFQHFYPYFDVIDVDWESELVRALKSARTDTDVADLLVTLRTLVAAADDGHGMVIHREMGRSVSVPFRVEFIEAQAIVVATADANIEVGDRVLAIDGTPALDALEQAETLISGSPQWKRAMAPDFVAPGPAGSLVEVHIEREGSEIVVDVNRSGMRARVTPAVAPVASVADGIWYIDFSRATDNLVEPHLAALASARGVIFDMRGYPADYQGSLLGHLTSEPLDSPQLLMPNIVFPDQERATFKQVGWHIDVREPRFTGQPVFLIGSGAVSAAETVAGMFEHYAFGPIVGQPTAGTNGNTNRISMPGGFSVIFTGMRVLKHDGSQHHLVGIQPTVPLEPTIAGIREGRDEYIEKAVEIIRAGAGNRP